MQIRAGVLCLTSGKEDFRIRSIINNNKGNHVIKGSIYQKIITMLNVYVFNNRASIYMKLKLN